MSRPLRFIPPGGSLVEVTCRTVQGRFLLRPSRVVNRRILGVLGRAQRLHDGIEIHAYVFLSNHYHLLLSAQTAQQLAAFMGYFDGNIAREIGRLHDWSEKFWAHRYHSILVSDEEEQQAARLDYLLSHGCKEGLVDSPRRWPGVTCVAALLEAKDDIGVWYDRSAAYEARQRGKKVESGQFQDEETVALSPLPCWKHLDARAYRKVIQERVDSIEAETHARHRRDGTSPLGRRAVLREKPHRRPPSLKRSPAPRFHCSTRAARTALRDAYRAFVASYREAVARFRAGERSVVFPDGAFLPPIPLQAPG